MSAPRFYVQLADGARLARFDLVWLREFGDDPSTWTPDHARHPGKAYTEKQIEKMRPHLVAWHGAFDVVPVVTAPGPYRADYESRAGLARWWSKDGAWHIAIPERGREGRFWTADSYATRADAVAALTAREKEIG